jgi:hypothetical protein
MTTPSGEPRNTLGLLTDLLASRPNNDPGKNQLGDVLAENNANLAKGTIQATREATHSSRGSKGHQS